MNQLDAGSDPRFKLETGFLAIPEFCAIPSSRCNSPRTSSLLVKPSIFAIKAAIERSFTSLVLRLNWLTRESSLFWKYSGLPSKNVFLTSVSVSLLLTRRSTAFPALTESTMRSKNWMSPPTISIRADLRASLTMPECALAMFVCASMAAISTSLSLLRRSLNSSCSLPTPSSTFMAFAFSSMP